MSRVLVTLDTDVLDADEAESITDFALALAEGSDADLVFLSPVVFPVKTPRYLPEDELAERRHVVDQALRVTEREGFDGTVTGAVMIGRNFKRIVTNAVSDYRIDTVLLAVPDRSGRFGRIRGTTAEQIAARADCNVVSVTPTTVPERIASILVPVAFGPHSGLAIDVAGALSRTHDAWVDVLHVVDVDASRVELDRARALVVSGLNRLGQYDAASPWILEAPGVTAAIVEQTAYYGMTVMGAPRTRGLERFVFGSITDDVRAGIVRTPVVTAESRTRSGLQPDAVTARRQ